MLDNKVEYIRILNSEQFQDCKVKQGQKISLLRQITLDHLKE